MSTVARKQRKVKPAEPVSGTCRWIIKPGLAFAAVLAINDVPYLVQENLVGLERVGFRFQKEDGTTYDLDTAEEQWTCDCPDFLKRRCNDPKGCKHVAGLRAALQRLAS